jgi:hypothetical protein
MNIWTFPKVSLVVLIIAYFAEVMSKDQEDKGVIKDKKGEEHEVEIEEHEVEIEEHEVEIEEHEVEIEEHEVETEEGEEHEVEIEEGEEHKGDKEDNEEDHEENADDPIGTDTYNPMSPSQHQLTTVGFESNKFGKLSTIVDGNNFRYRIHRRSKNDQKRWYRCVSRFSNNCRATACYDVCNNVISKLSNPHNHSPPVFTRVVRYLKVDSYLTQILYPYLSLPLHLLFLLH